MKNGLERCATVGGNKRPKCCPDNNHKFSRLQQRGQVTPRHNKTAQHAGKNDGVTNEDKHVLSSLVLC